MKKSVIIPTISLVVLIIVYVLMALFGKNGWSWPVAIFKKEDFTHLDTGYLSMTSTEPMTVAQTATDDAEFSDIHHLSDIGTDFSLTDPHILQWKPDFRVSMKNYNHAAADPLRGDLPIQKGPEASCNWFNSRYGPGDGKHDAMFSSMFNEKFAKLTGQHTSMPANVSNEGTIHDAYQ